MPFSILAHPPLNFPRGSGQQIERAPRPRSVHSEVYWLKRKSVLVFAGFSISGSQFWRERRFDSLRISPDCSLRVEYYDEPEDVQVCAHSTRTRHLDGHLFEAFEFPMKGTIETLMLEEQQDKLGEYRIKLDKFLGSKSALQCGMANKSKKGGWPVYLYVPNIIGYIRIIANCIAFAHCFSDKKVFTALYFVSFVCDELDGRFARMFNQVSAFGAVLDMVTDRMYSTFLSSKTSHKDVKDSTSWLLRAYYGHRLFMGYCCVGSEILYIILFLLSGSQSESVIDVLVNTVRNKSVFSLPILVALPGWAVKQVVNVIQMKTAADVCVLYNSNSKEKP